MLREVALTLGQNGPLDRVQQQPRLHIDLNSSMLNVMAEAVAKTIGDATLRKLQRTGIKMTSKQSPGLQGSWLSRGLGTWNSLPAVFTWFRTYSTSE